MIFFNQLLFSFKEQIHLSRFELGAILIIKRFDKGSPLQGIHVKEVIFCILDISIDSQTNQTFIFLDILE